MGLVLFPIKTKIQTETSTLALRQYNEGLLQARSNILSFVYNHVLIGEGWQALKEHLLCHVSVIEGLIMVNEELICANSQLSDMVGWEILVEDDLQAIVNGLYEVYSALQNTLATLETMALLILDPAGRGAIEAAIVSTQGSILICEQSIEYTNSKIQKLYDINAATADIYIDFQTKYVDVNAGIEAIRNAWNGTSYNYSEMNMEWINNISEAWHNKEAEIITTYDNIIGRTRIIDNQVIINSFIRISSAYNNLGENNREHIADVSHIVERLMSLPLGGIISMVTDDNQIERDVWALLEWPVGSVLAFSYNQSEDYYRTTETYGAQRAGGFGNIFDDLGGYLGMNLDTDYIEFSYPNSEGTSYRFQLWNGSYEFGQAYGAEIGFYQSNDGTDWYACAGNILDDNGNVNGIGEIETEQYLLSRTGEVLLHNNTAAYAIGGDHYWNLMIRTSSDYNRGDFVQVCFVDFGDSTVAEAFISQYNDDQESPNPEVHHSLFIERVEDGSSIVRIVYE